MPAGRIALWVASLGGLALCARSLLIGPVPLEVAYAAFGVYFALVIAGVLVPQLEMFGDVLYRGDASRPEIALTFDDGPHPVTTRKVLEHLARAGVKATFFVIGEKVERHPDVVRDIARAGHAIGAHGYRHDRLYAFKPPAAVVDDIRKTCDVIERATGARPHWFRPPVGQVSPRTAAGVKRAGLETVAWSVRGLDGLASAVPERVAERIERGLTPGAVVLLHDASEHDDRFPASIDALPRILESIQRRGLRVSPLDELFADE